MAKQRISKQEQSRKDKEENSRFLLILAISTLLLMGLMYVIFVG